MDSPQGVSNCVGNKESDGEDRKYNGCSNHAICPAHGDLGEDVRCSYFLQTPTGCKG